MKEPVCVVRFYEDNGGYRFEVDATNDPVKPWAEGYAGGIWGAANLAVPYIAHSTEGTQ